MGSDALPDALAWPQGLDAARFLAEFWQRRPLLLPGALPGFESPLSPDELAGLATEADTAPRLLIEDDAGDFHVEHGPFDEDRFATLGGRFSLLVTDVEKHLPELQAWIRAFRLVPAWRFDDLMVSYAPDGGSVGAHVDAYDVFLLQASGTRRWSIDASVGAGAAAPEAGTVRRGDLALVEPFRPTDTFELGPGDALYLPPGVPHHGVAVGEGCTTWSIGFRAPSAAEIVAGVAALLIESLDERPLPDPPLALGPPGRIAPESLRALRAAWERAVQLDDGAFARLAGRVLTTSRLMDAGMDDGEDDGEDDDSNDGEDGPNPAASATLERSSFARFAWADAAAAGPGSVTLFANGRAVDCSREFAERMCDPEAPVPAAPSLAPPDAAAIAILVAAGALRVSD